MAAAAVDDVSCGNRVALVARKVVHGHHHALALFDQRFKAMAIAQVDASEGSRKIPQDWIEPDLVAALRAFGTGGRGPDADVMRAVGACDLKACQRRAIERRVWKIGRSRSPAHLFSDAPAPQELHRARVDGGRARMVG